VTASARVRRCLPAVDDGKTRDTLRGQITELWGGRA